MRVAKGLKCWECLCWVTVLFLGQLTVRRRGKEHLEREVTRKSHRVRDGRTSNARNISEKFDKYVSQVVFSYWRLCGEGDGAGDFLSLGSVFQDFMTLAEPSQTFCIVARIGRVWLNSTCRTSGLKMSLPMTGEQKCHRAAVMGGRTDEPKRLHGTLI